MLTELRPRSEEGEGRSGRRRGGGRRLGRGTPAVGSRVYIEPRAAVLPGTLSAVRWWRWVVTS